MRRPANLIGQKFGWLVVTEKTNVPATNGTQWRCKCRCGEEALVRTGNLRGGITTSCGCKRNLHRCSGSNGCGTPTPEYYSWTAMLTRCYNPNTPPYKNYGARGIRVCRQWRRNFKQFLQDMGLRPSKDHVLDRRKVNEGYSPKNCRWVTRAENNKNMRRTVFYTFKGRKLCISDWAREVGIDKSTMRDRFLKFSVKKAIIGKVRR